jgi:pimeloyl-ACP methyl ester carboxylesterase
MPDTVFLLHGLWLRAFTLVRLARALRREGYFVHGYNYRSLRDQPDQAMAALAKRVNAAAPPVHLVGHSLGGLIALSAIREHRLAVARVVCLGSPLCGSLVARRLADVQAVRGMLGRSRDLMADGLGQWDGSTEVGVIAGSRSLGLGFLAGRIERPHDGTVSVAETRLPGIRDHIIIDTTHSGLLFSAKAARQTTAFLREGRFLHHD